MASSAKDASDAKAKAVASRAIDGGTVDVMSSSRPQRRDEAAAAKAAQDIEERSKERRAAEAVAKAEATKAGVMGNKTKTSDTVAQVADAVGDKVAEVLDRTGIMPNRTSKRVGDAVEGVIDKAASWVTGQKRSVDGVLAEAQDVLRPRAGAGRAPQRVAAADRGDNDNDRFHERDPFVKPRPRPPYDQLAAYIDAAGGNVERAAEEYGVSRGQFSQWLKAAGIDPREYRGAIA